MANQRLQSYAIEMVMQARDETKAAFESTQGNMQRFMQQGLRAATAARVATIGVELVTMGVRIYKGELDALDDAMKQYPLGVGQFHSALRELESAYTDSGKAAAKAAEAAERAFKFTGGLQALQDFKGQMQARTAIMRAEGFEREKLQAEETARESRKKALAVAAEAGISPRHGYVAAALEEIHWGQEWALAQAAQRRDAAAEAKRIAEKAKADQQAEQERRAAEDKANMLRGLATREYNATAEDFGRQLRALDDFYAREREQWKGHADVMAALQDAEASERAAAFMAEQERLAQEWDEAWVKEGKAPAELSGLAGRASAPLLISRTLTGGAAANPAQLTNKHLAQVVDLLGRIERRATVDVVVEN